MNKAASTEPQNPNMQMAALAYAKTLGWKVFPTYQPHFGHDGRPWCTCRDFRTCTSPGKHPRTAHGVKDASADEQVIRAWWSENPHANIGVACGEASGFWVLDVDPQNGGDDALADLESQHGWRPDTVEAITGGAGRHLLFSLPEGVKIRNRVGFAPGLDTRSHGGYIIVAPSLHTSHRRYQWEASSRPGEVPLARAPGWLLELVVGAPGEQLRGVAPLDEAAMPDLNGRIARARKYLARIPGAVSGHGGHLQTWLAAVALARGFGLPEHAALELLSAEFNPRCEPPWEMKDLEHKVTSAAKDCRRPLGYLLGDRPLVEDPDGYELAERDAIRNEERADRAPPTEQNGVALIRLDALLAPALERASRRRTGDEKPIPVPFAEYSEILGGGFWPGAHFIVAGPGAGKSQKTIQVSLASAIVGVPVTYVGLELDEAQIAMRALGAHGHFPWSGLYLGRCPDALIEKAGAAAQALTGLPFYADFGPARGWPASRLVGVAEAMRKTHPAGPMLIVLDYLQLVGDEPREFERRPDLRERIGGAAYAARDVARRFDAAVLVVSSAARAHYGLLANAAGEAGLSTTNTGLGGKVKTIAHPHVLVGLGKESGEVEFSADTVTVLVKWPTALENGSTAVLCTVPKVRWGKERWCALEFNGGRFESLHIDTLDELPEAATSKRGGRPNVEDGDLVGRIVATLRRLGPTKSRRKLVDLTEGRSTKLYAAIKAGILAGRIVSSDNGTLTAAEVSQ